MKPTHESLLAGLAAFILLSLNLASTPIASGWIDPLLDYGAQDEATYTAESIHMARDGGWMTPVLNHRWTFEKPPMLVWLSALSIRAFGLGRFTPRLPAVLSGALVAALVYWMVRQSRSRLAAIAAALLSVSNQLLFTLSRHNMTDILLTACGATALAALFASPTLSRLAPRLLFVVAVAAAIATKSIAGVLPLAAAIGAAFWLPGHIASRVRILSLLGLGAIALASPWFVYNWVTHRAWFLADMGFQVFTVGLRPTYGPSGNGAWFYLERLLYEAPAAALLFVSAVPAFVTEIRRRDPKAILLASFLGVTVIALAAFQFHSATYLAPLMPVIIIAAALYSPLLAKPYALPSILALVCIAVIKVSNPDQDWGLTLSPAPTVPAIPVLSTYCGERRATTLYIYGVEDQFYALVLPLNRVVYIYNDPQNRIPQIRPHLVFLGIVQPANLIRIQPYLERLQSWGLDSTAPIGTALVVRDPLEFATFVGRQPESDILTTPAALPFLIADPSHRIQVQTPDLVLLESAQLSGASSPGGCRP